MTMHHLARIRDCKDATEVHRGARLRVRLAQTWGEVEAAQRLRWRVFSEELGAQLQGRSGVDHDRFDDHCDHLIALDQASGRVIGTYRLLTPAGASRAGGLYCESEFDLTRLGHLRGSMMEVGRACVDPVWRGSAVLSQMWGTMYRFALQHRVETIVGCASVSIADNGLYAADLALSLESALVDPDSRVTPHNPFEYRQIASGLPTEPPTLIKAYLKAGAKVGGTPAYDSDFNCADFLMILPLQQMSARFARRFEGGLSRSDDRLAA
jgi:putative hemolysin